MDKNDCKSMVYSLADALQFSLFLCRDNKEAPFYVKGYGNFGIPLTPSRELGVKAKVEVSGIGARESFVVCSVMGNLWFLLSYDDKMKELGFSLLNLGGLTKEQISRIPTLKSKSVKEVYDFFLPVIVGMWMRETKNANWSRLDDVGPVGKSTVRSVEEALGADSSAGAG